MPMTRRLFAGTAAAAALLGACATRTAGVDPEVRAALAPTGTLRVGVYPGSPSSLVRTKRGEEAGVARDLGLALGERLGVPVQLVRFSRVAQVVDAIKDGQVDFTVTNASPARARDVDFTPPIIAVELGYLVPAGSPIDSIAEVDRPGMRIGVTQGSTSQTTLDRQFRNATLVPAASMDAAKDLLRTRAVDAFATNKGILYELSDDVPQSRVIDGRWGLEHIAIAIPKGRGRAMPFLVRFADEMRAGGRLPAIVAKAGLRGTAPD
jgi:polar amino acid transport system substrate-binding protein